MSKWADLKTRTISAVVMVAGFVFIMEIHPYAFFGLLAVAYPIMLKEWFGLVLGRPKELLFSFIGVLYLTAGALSLAAIHYFSIYVVKGDALTWNLIYFIVSMIIAIDVGGYVFGKLFGKHKLAPKISPGKTWEGVLGSILFAIPCIFTWVWLDAKNSVATEVWIFTAVFMGLIPALVATAGDLFESHMKRRAGVKDSGILIPGHGGILDRIDGLLAVSIYFAVPFLVGSALSYIGIIGKGT